MRPGSKNPVSRFASELRNNLGSDTVGSRAKASGPQSSFKFGPYTAPVAPSPVAYPGTPKKRRRATGGRDNSNAGPTVAPP